MKIIFFVLIIINTFAYSLGDFSLSFEHGYNVYKVYSNDKMAKLTFPYSVVLAGGEFDVKDFTFYVYYPVKDYVLNSVDYDYTGNDLTVSSYSNNHLDDYKNFGIKYDKNYYFDVNFKKEAFFWKETWQNNIEYHNTLKYDIKQYLVKFGKNYDNLLLYLVSGYSHNKDSHLLRDFYTIQKGFLLGAGVRLKYNINKNFIFKLGIERLELNTDMRYYEAATGYYYLKLKSKYFADNYNIIMIYRF
jgi:hypothetical protein